MCGIPYNVAVFVIIIEAYLFKKSQARKMKKEEGCVT